MSRLAFAGAAAALAAALSFASPGFAQTKQLDSLETLEVDPLGAATTRREAEGADEGGAEGSILLSPVVVVESTGGAAQVGGGGPVASDPGGAHKTSAPTVAGPAAAFAVGAAGRATSESQPPATGAEAGKAPAEEVVLFIRRDTDRQAFLLDALQTEIDAAQQSDQDKKPGGVRYSLSDNVSAAVSYKHAFLFDTASDEELRKSRVGSFSSARERDVFGLGMDWGVGENSSVGIGYQLQSVRPNNTTPSSGGGGSLLPGSEDVDHAFTLGVTRSWGASDGK